MFEDDNLRLFKTELARLISKHAVGLEESSILGVLEEYCGALKTRPKPVAHNSPSPPTAHRPPPAVVSTTVHEMQQESSGLDFQHSEAFMSCSPADTLEGAALSPADTLEGNAPLSERAEKLRRLKARHDRNVSAPTPAAGIVHRAQSRPTTRSNASMDAGPQPSKDSAPKNPAHARFVERASEMLLSRTSDLRIKVNQLGLEFHERLLFDQALDQPRSFAVVLRHSLLPREETIASLARLEAAGLLQITTPGLDEARSTSGREIMKDAVEGICAMEHRLEHLDALGVFDLHWTTHDAEIARRFKHLSARFHMMNQPLGMETEDRQRLKVVREQLQKTYAMLCDSRQRQRYRREFIAAAEIEETARSLETLGEAALQKNAPGPALDCVQRLLELEPKNAQASRLLPTLLVRANHRS